MYIKPEVKKNDATAMNTALNKVGIGWLHENCHLVRGIFRLREMRNFFATGQDSPSMYKVSPKGFREGATQSIPGGSNKKDLERGIFLVIWGT